MALGLCGPVSCWAGKPQLRPWWTVTDSSLIHSYSEESSAGDLYELLAVRNKDSYVFLESVSLWYSGKKRLAFLTPTDRSLASLKCCQSEVRAVRPETTSEWLQWPLEISNKGTQRMLHADRSVGKPLATSIWGRMESSFWEQGKRRCVSINLV